jgi:hypothetical protein
MVTRSALKSVTSLRVASLRNEAAQDSLVLLINITPVNSLLGLDGVQSLLLFFQNLFLLSIGFDYDAFLWMVRREIHVGSLSQHFRNVSTVRSDSFSFVEKLLANTGVRSSNFKKIFSVDGRHNLMFSAHKQRTLESFKRSVQSEKMFHVEYLDKFQYCTSSEIDATSDPVTRISRFILLLVL